MGDNLRPHGWQRSKWVPQVSMLVTFGLCSSMRNLRGKSKCIENQMAVSAISRVSYNNVVIRRPMYSTGNPQLYELICST